MNDRIKRIIDKLPEETKEKVSNDAIVWFECRRQSINYCKCGRKRAINKCEYPLRGSKEGQFCDKLLCESCGIEIDNKFYCYPHAKMIRNG